MPKPTVASVYLMHPTLCIYRTKHSYYQRITLFLVNFLKDVTHCNISLPIGKYWMLPIITSARKSVKCMHNLKGQENAIELRMTYFFFNIYFLVIFCKTPYILILHEFFQILEVKVSSFLKFFGGTVLSLSNFHSFLNFQDPGAIYF